MFSDKLTVCSCLSSCFAKDPKTLEVYGADFVIDGPQLGFLGKVASVYKQNMEITCGKAYNLWLRRREWSTMEKST